MTMRGVAGIAGLGLLVAGAGAFYSYWASRAAAEDTARFRAQLDQQAATLTSLRQSLLSEMDGLRREQQANSAWLASLDRSRAARDTAAAGPETSRVALAAVEASAERVPGHALLRDFERLAGEPKRDALKVLADLAQMGDRAALEKVLGALLDADPKIRGEAVEAVADQGDPALVPRLEPLLDDSDPDVRREVASALGSLAGPRSGELLLGLVNDADRQVVRESIVALGRMRHAEAQPALLALVNHSDSSLASNAGGALLRLGDEAGAQAALDHVALGLQRPAERERLEAVKSILRINLPSARSYLETALRDPNANVRQMAERALARGERDN